MIMFAEIRKDGQWYKVGKEFVSTYEEMEGQLTDRVFDGHNKELEEFLVARSHFFDVDISDVSDDIKNHKAFNHKAGFKVTLEEIINFWWDEERYKTGYITEWQYERLKKYDIKPVNVLKELHKGTPRVSPFLMDLIINFPSLRNEQKYFIEYKYDKYTAKELFEFFCNESISGLIKLIPEGGTTEDVRIIFSI